MTDVLRIRDLNKSFGGIVVADDINLDLRAGRVLGLIGPNGAGKTSLFNLVTGVVKPDTGSITLDGQSIDALTIYQRAGNADELLLAIGDILHARLRDPGETGAF